MNEFNFEQMPLQAVSKNSVFLGWIGPQKDGWIAAFVGADRWHGPFATREMAAMWLDGLRVEP